MHLVWLKIATKQAIAHPLVVHVLKMVAVRGVMLVFLVLRLGKERGSLNPCSWFVVAICPPELRLDKERRGVRSEL